MIENKSSRWRNPSCHRPLHHHARPKTHLAAHTACHVRPILPLVDQSAQPTFVAPAFIVHTSHSIKYLIYLSKPNIMFVNLRICACGICVFTDKWWWWLWIEYMNLCLCFFFFFWLFGFMSLWLFGSWAIIGKCDRKRNGNSTRLKIVNLEKVFIGNE